MAATKSDFNTCAQKQANSVKNKFHGFIKANDYVNVRKLSKLFNIDPHEELSKQGYLWNSFHYACHFDKPKILEYLIQITYRKYPNDYEKIINIRTTEKWTPLAIAMIYDKPECIKILFKYGGIILNPQDKDNRTPLELAVHYKQKNAENEYKKQLEEAIITKNDQGLDFLPPQLGALQGSPSLEELLEEVLENELDDTQKIQYRELLLHGERYPCTICLSDLGYLKYTECCGQPIHGNCKQQTTFCPLCHHSNLTLIDQIKYPERALFLSSNVKY